MHYPLTSTLAQGREYAFPATQAFVEANKSLTDLIWGWVSMADFSMKSRSRKTGGTAPGDHSGNQFKNAKERFQVP